MNRTEEHNAVPTHVWIKTFIISFILFWGGYFFYMIRDYLIDKPEASESIYKSDLLNDDKRIDIYVLGSSLTRSAFWKFHSFNEIAAKKKLNTHCKFVTKNSVCLNDYAYKIPEIRNLKPQFLFIESNLVCNMGFTQPVPKSFLIYSSRLARIPGYIVRLKGEVVQLFSSRTSQEYLEKYIYTDPLHWSWEKYKEQADKFQVRTMEEFPEWNSFFKEAKCLGIHVNLLDLPRSKEAEKYLPKDFHKALDSLLAQYKIIYGVDYISFPDKLDQKIFYEDPAHFNKTGGDVYSEWFLKTLNDKKNIYSD